MSLKIQINTDGTFRSTWWGRLSVKGRKRETNLGIPIEGTVPVDSSGKVRLSATGDEAFERSRKAAQKAFEAWRREVQKDPAELQAKAYKARTGEDLGGLPLSKLYANWKNLMRDKSPTETWCGVVKTWLASFVKFCEGEAKRRNTKCETVNDVTPEIAAAWYEHIKAEFAWKTVKSKKNLVCGIFARLQATGLARINPFATIQSRGGGSGDNRKVARKALDLAELEKVLDCARGDGALYPLVVAAACTGMRLGDVCNLKWADVDLKQGLITCVTAKAGVRVTIPILGRLQDVLSGLSPDGSPYVFPDAQAQYARNKDKLIRDVKPLFARAVIVEGEAPARKKADGPKRRLEEVVGGAGFTEFKRKRLLEVYARFKAGMRSSEIAAELDVARSQVSMDLRDIEKLTGEALRPMAARKAQAGTRLDLIEKTRQERKVGKRAACIYGWHSFRHTFVVLALKAGVPVEDVRRIVGHGEAETTLSNYYNPEAKHAAESLRKGMAGTVLDVGTRKGRKRGGAPSPRKTAADRLRELKTLADEGLVTPEEYAAQRKAIIGSV